MNEYAIYLRKSRADSEAESRGEGETLARHERLLIAVAKSQNLTITNIYREILSGETIASRPVMQQLLSDVEQGFYKGVLVVEVERLARGDTIDQGIVSQAFKISNTKIITPLKTYDPNNEFDEEYFEFGLFMSRREYKTINRRMQNGRIASVKEGKYVGNKAPYGYDRLKISGDKGFTLIPNNSEAEIVRMIFQLYTCENRIGVSLITRTLNDMGYKPRVSNDWTNPTIQDILKNPIYIGKIRWNARKQVKKIVNGEVTKTRPRAKTEDITYANGLHEPLIDIETWEKAQDFITRNRRTPTPNKALTNPLAGLIVCGKCGRKMTRRWFTRNQKEYLLCPITSCNNVSVEFGYVEEAILNGLRNILNEYKLEIQTAELRPAPVLEKKFLTNINKEIEKVSLQMDKLHDFLEQGVYTIEMFIERSKVLAEKKESLINELKHVEKKLSENSISKSKIDAIPKITNAIELYHTLESPELKNRLLKSVIEKIVYTKDKGGRWNNDPKEFKIEIFTKV